jgi:hypothetical protein
VLCVPYFIADAHPEVFLRGGGVDSEAIYNYV